MKWQDSGPSLDFVVFVNIPWQPWYGGVKWVQKEYCCMIVRIMIGVWLRRLLKRNGSLACLEIPKSRRLLFRLLMQMQMQRQRQRQALGFSGLAVHLS